MYKVKPVGRTYLKIIVRMKKVLYIICLGVMIFSCRKDIDELEIEYEYPGIKEYVKTNIAGTIADENDNAIPDAIVVIGNKSIKTDINGIFQIRNLLIDANNLTISVNKAGYFPGYRSITVSPNSKNYISIKLIKTNIVNNIQADAGGLISYNDYSIDIPANSMILDNGVPYNGTVKVISKWLDPTDEEFGNKMPGRLMGLNTQGNLTGLISMGILAVNLASSTGDLLLLKPGAEAKIRMRVPVSILNEAPATIPLWHFHPVKKIWIEEGSATLVNGFYEGKVSHFSFWNLDVSVPVIKLKFKVQDNNGIPAVNAKIKLQIGNTNQIGIGYTDDKGEVSGFVPQNQIFNSEIYLPFGSCVIPVIKQQIGPFTDNKTINHILLSSQLSIYKINGNLINCDNEAVQNGYVKINGEINNIIWADDTGHFENSILLCKPLNNAITLKGYDSQSFKVSTEKIAVFSANNKFEAGTIQICDNPTDYITYTFNGYTYTFLDPSIYNTASWLHVTKETNQYDMKIHLAFFHPINKEVGNFPLEYFTITGKDNKGNEVKHVCNMTCDSIKTEVIENDGIGGYISGTFKGSAIDSSLKSDVKVIKVTGSYRGKWN